HALADRELPELVPVPLPDGLEPAGADGAVERTPLPDVPPGRALLRDAGGRRGAPKGRPLSGGRRRGGERPGGGRPGDARRGALSPRTPMPELPPITHVADLCKLFGLNVPKPDELHYYAATLMRSAEHAHALPALLADFASFEGWLKGR